LSARSRNVTLIIAAALLTLAILLSLDIARNDPLKDLAREINAYGYYFTAEDFYVLGGAEDTSIAALLGKQETDLADAVAASRACGFPSNVDAAGDITALLANAEQGVVTVYLRDGSIELCFLQGANGEALPLK